MKKIWKRLLYNGTDYGDRIEVSNYGEFRNVITKKIYKWSINHNGYAVICISLGSRQNKKSFKIHKGVAETFILNPYNLPEVNHIDGNKLNNGFWNLEWVCGMDNMRHAVNYGLQKTQKGVNHPLSTLSETDIRYIKEKYIPKDKNFGCRALAKRFNVDHSTVSRLVNDKTYRKE